MLIVTINSGASVYKEQLRIDGILKCTTDEQVKAIVRLRELEQTPFETLIKNYYSITGSFNFKTPTKIPVVEKQEVLFKESLFNPPQLVAVQDRFHCRVIYPTHTLPTPDPTLPASKVR